MKITLERKILGGFIICSLILLVIVSYSFRNSEQFVETNQLVNHTQEVLYEFEQILVNSINAEAGARGFVITGNEDFLEPFTDSKVKISQHISRLRELSKDNPALQKNIDDVEKLIAPRLNHLEAYAGLRRTEGFESAQKVVLSGVGKKLQDEIKGIITAVKISQQRILSQRREASEEEGKKFNIIFAVLLISITVVLIAVYFIVITNLRALRKAESETADKNWTLTGSSELVKAIQGNRGQTELADIIIHHLATYLDIQVGAFYLTEENSTSLRLTSAYAMDRKDPGIERVEFGEGLVGQAAASRNVSLLKAIPSDYFSVSTSFGKVKPKAIVAVPFVFESRVVGVVVLGTIDKFSALQLQYLNVVTDSIAIAITSAHMREKAKELFEETQRQAEELEEQQHELKQANEELHAKTEQLENSGTELRLQQEELQRTNEELEEKADMLNAQKEKLEIANAEIESKAREIENTSKYKSQFLANMSHELRTPLNSILLLSQLLSENRNNILGEKEVEFAKNIHSSGSDLLNLINEILDLSKVEAGKMQLEISGFSFQSIISDMSVMFSELAKNKSIDFQMNYNEKALPADMISDRQRVGQILKNLLSNAFKFTDNGGSIRFSIDKPGGHVSLRNENLNDPNNVVAFSVSDTGVGIPKEKQEIIFEAFQQVDGSAKRKYGGTGLGLSISRELANALGGEIHVASEAGKGSTFTLYLPIKPDASADVAAVPADREEPGVPHKKQSNEEVLNIQHKYESVDDRSTITEKDPVILIVEDDENFAKALLSFVRDRKYKGVIAHEGNVALSYARHYRPDAILLDMKLPVMEGSEVLRQLKIDPELRHIPVQIISFYDKRKEGLALGAFDYLQKPASPADLQLAFDRIERFTRKVPKKLLIVEDNEQQNHAVKELIGNGDVKSFSAYSGEEAYRMLQAENFDCIIVDLGLPHMSGFELLEKIRANDSLNKIPVIVYTARDLQKEENMLLNKLADTVVLKTANSHERLLDETTLFLHRVESRLPKEKQKIIRKLHKADEVLKGRKVLLVDDDIRNIYSLSNALEEEGMQCVAAENGKVALEILNADPQFDLVLMDVMMPEMDGFEATVAIRNIPELRKLPIIALTAKAMKGDKEKCLAAGMSDYISKPVDLERLFSLMRVWLYR